MKSIELKTVTEKVHGFSEEQEFKTIELIRSAVNYNPPIPGSGFDFKNMTDRIRILDVLDSVNGAETLSLEDADYENLSRYVKETKWNILSRTIADFVKSFEK